MKLIMLKIKIACNAAMEKFWRAVFESYMWRENIHNGLRFAHYPPCDHLNHALNFLLSNPVENRMAIEEICYAIIKAGGYYYPHVAEALAMYGFGNFVTEDRVYAD